MSRSGAQYLSPGMEMGARMRPNTYYTANNGSTINGTPTLNNLNAIPLFVPRSGTLAKLAINVSTLGAGSVTRLGVYSDIQDSYGGMPGNLLVDAGTVDCSTVGIKEALVGIPITPGLYWLAAVVQNATCAMNLMQIGNGQLVGVNSANSIAGRISYYMTNQSGALPSVWGSTSTTGSAHLVMAMVN